MNEFSSWKKKYDSIIKRQRLLIDLAYMRFLEWDDDWMNNIVMPWWQEQYGYFPIYSVGDWYCGNKRCSNNSNIMNIKEKLNKPTEE